MIVKWVIRWSDQSRARSACRAWLLVALLLGASELAATENMNDPQYWLSRLGTALNMTSYRGVFVYARGDQVSSMQIAHRFKDGMVQERLVLQDGKAGEIVRKGMNVVCVLPEHGRLELSEVIPSGPFAETFASQLLPVGRWYNPVVVGEGRIAGYDVVKLALKAKDELRYSHQLWLEKSTGLPLKGHVLSESGEVLEHFQFTSLEIRESLPDQEFVTRSAGREVSRTIAEGSPARPSASVEGWTMGWQPAGFEPAAAPLSGGSRAIAFSDGMASFSVFVEPARNVNMPSGTSRIGATTVFMKQLEKESNVFTVTVVGEIPLRTAHNVAKSVDIQDARAIGANLP